MEMFAIPIRPVITICIILGVIVGIGSIFAENHEKRNNGTSREQNEAEYGFIIAGIFSFILVIGSITFIASMYE